MTSTASVDGTITPSGERPGRLRALDGYRAAAALMVLVTHCAFSTGEIDASAWGHLLGRLDFGVTLFFLLSGFLLYRPWARAALVGGPAPALGPYARRRAARILPLYWLVVTVVLLTLPSLHPVAAATWWQHLLAVQIYVPRGTVDGLTQTWSLCTEIAFYAVLPLIGRLALGRRRTPSARPLRRQAWVLAACAAVAISFVAVFGFTSVLPEQAGFWLPFYLDWFAAGMALAVVEAALRTDQPPRIALALRRLAQDEATMLVAAACLFVIVVTPLGGGYDFTQWTGPWELLARHVLYGLVGLLLLVPCVLADDSWLSRTLARPWPHRLGLISYGIFLWHVYLLQVVMDATHIAPFTGRFWWVTSLVLMSTLLVSTVTYRLVERPAQRWAHRAAASRR